MGTLRAVFILAVLGIVTPLGMALQAILLATGSRAAGGLPVHYHRLVRAMLGLRVATHGRLGDERPLLVLANHVSWLDIVILGGLAPLSFVAKQELASWPVVGRLARLQRTVFVDRERRVRTRHVGRELGYRLVAGDIMVLFAEGTSSDGNRVLPFRSALLGAAHDVARESGRAKDVLVQPVAIAYTRINGMPMGRQHRPIAAWHGDLDLVPHVWRLLRSGTIDVEVAFGAPIPLGDANDRKTVAAAAEVAVRQMALNLLVGRAAT